MTRPGVEIISRAQPLARSLPTDTGVWFIAGATGTRSTDDNGDPIPVMVGSMTEYQSMFGSRGSGAVSVMYDSVDTYFREGGSRVYVSPLPTGSVGDDTDVLAALDRLGAGLGPGQVSAPGSTSPAVQAGLLDHAATHNRVALIGALATDSVGLIAEADVLAAETNARYGALFAPQAVVPSVGSGPLRFVPWEAVVAGLISRNDVRFTANQPAAGVNGISSFSIMLSATFTDQEYEDLNAAGVDMGRNVYGTIENYGYRTLAGAGSPWLNLGNARLNMEIVAAGGAIAERYVFSQLDGRYRTITDFGGELSAMLVPYYEAGALFGFTADEAFRVDVGAQVNTPTTIANGELHAVIEVRMSPFAELVVIEIVKVSTVESLAA